MCVSIYIYVCMHMYVGAYWVVVMMTVVMNKATLKKSIYRQTMPVLTPPGIIGQ